MKTLLIVLIIVFLITFIEAITLPGIKKHMPTEKLKGIVGELVVYSRVFSILSLVTILIILLFFNPL